MKSLHRARACQTRVARVCRTSRYPCTVEAPVALVSMSPAAMHHVIGSPDVLRGQGLSLRQLCPSSRPLSIAAPIRRGSSRINTIAVRAIAAPPRPQEVSASNCKVSN